MARSPAHKFGQIIGDMVEAAIHGPLKRVAGQYDLYFDHKHIRPARDGRRKVSWKDSKGNEHDLDYVLEEGGSERTLGTPKAFIEIAWRRYIKHSRNKAQEIQGAVIPLAETYRDSHPFLGAVLAGVFTDGSLSQLRSHGSCLLYFPYESVLAAFAEVGIDAAYDEATPDVQVQQKVNEYKALSDKDKKRIVDSLKRRHQKDLKDFLDSLRASLSRRIVSICIVPLHGTAKRLRSLRSAVTFLQNYEESECATGFVKYEVAVRYSNGDEIRGAFRDKTEAIRFLSSV